MLNLPIKPLPKGETKTKEEFLEGVTILINKPKTWTSFDVVNKVRSSLKYRLGIKKIKVGHAGTLDPLATGLLTICIGRHTKRISELTGLPKTYTGQFFIGATTPSYDLETAVDATYPTEQITDKLLAQAVAKFQGKITQIPPIFSAIKQDGKRLYKIARAGSTVEIKSREVEIISFTINNVNLPTIDFVVDCSKGTYIRSLAFDFGKALGSGGYLAELTRTKVGDYSLEQAWELDEFIESLPEKEPL